MPTCSYPPIVVILGPTASGKSDLALRLAEKFDGEIVNADSMQIYRGMDIGTAKPTAEERQRVPHHLLDIVTPGVNFSASDFRREASAAIARIHGRGKRAFVVGGTGLYLRALLHGLVDSPHGDEGIRAELKAKALEVGNEGLLRLLAQHDPVTAASLHPNNQVRVIRALEVYLQTGRPMSDLRSEHGFSDASYDCLKVGLQVAREELYRRIDLRVDAMVEAGLEDEVRSLLNAGFHPQLKAMKAIGYREMAAYLGGEISREEAIRLVKRNTRHYAKRQMTWFARETEINWLEYPEYFASICNCVIEFFAKGEDYAESTL